MIKNKLQGNIHTCFEEKFWLYLVSLLCICIGIVLGIYCVKYLGTFEKNDLVNYINSFTDSFSAQSFNYKATFLETLKNNIPIFVGIWFLGLTMIGIPIILILDVIKGFTVGFTSCFIISDIGMKGILITLVGILPQNIIYIPCIIEISVISMEFSLKLLKDKASKQWTSNIFYKVATYCGSFLVVFLIMFIGFILESYITPNIMKVVVINIGSVII